MATKKLSPLPLPSKRELRAVIKKYREPSKSVLSYFGRDEYSDFAIEEKSLIIAHRRVYAMFWYSRKSRELEFVGFVNPRYESIGFRVKANKWTQDVFLLKNSTWDKEKQRYIYNYAFLTENIGQRFFKHAEKDCRLSRFIENRIGSKKEHDRFKKIINGMLARERAFNANYNLVDKNFIRWGYRRLRSFGVFDLADRHTCTCKECGNTFHTDVRIINKAEVECPNCKRTLIVMTEKTLPVYDEVGCQYLDSDIHGRLVVRHFLFQRNLSLGTKGYLEYERNPFPAEGPHIFEYHVQRWNGTLNQYTWYHKKPIQGACRLFAMREIFYANEYLYKNNFANLGTQFSEIGRSGLTAIANSDKLRAEEHLFKYRLAPNVIECLLKAGYANVVSHTYDFTFEKYKDDKNANRILKGLIPKYKEFLKKSYFGIEDIGLIHKAQFHNIPPAELELMLNHSKQFNPTPYGKYNVKLISDFLSDCESFNVSPHKAYRYIVEKGNDYQIWHDFCDWSVKVLGTDNIKRNSLFPGNLLAAHDRMFRTYEETIKHTSKDYAEMNAKCAALYRHLLELHLGDLNLGNGYAVVIPKDKIDFSLEGHNLNNCVGGDGYFRNHSNRKGLIFFFRQAANIEKSYACCEAVVQNGKLVLRQCYVYHNGKPDAKTKKAANQYVEKLNKVLQFTKTNQIKIFSKAA